MRKSIQLHEKVRAHVATLGASGEAWVASLPDLLRRLEKDWDIVIGEPFSNATEAYVVEAVTSDGVAAALKIPIAGLKKADREMQVLRAARGRGYARLLRHDVATNALLLERLGVQLARQGLPIDDQIKVICSTLRRAWAPLPPDLRLMSGAEKANDMASYFKAVWPKLGEPCSRKVIDTALDFAERRAAAFDSAHAVMSHGDAHAWNTLYDGKDGDYKFVDPDGLFIEPAHDLSISMREWCAELLDGDPVAQARQRCTMLSRLGGADFDAIWQWGFIETLMNGLLYTEMGSIEYATPSLALVEAWAAAGS